MSKPAPAHNDKSPPVSDERRGPVLVVDSDPAVRRVLRLVLEGAGWSCLTAGDVDTALELVAREHPKLVLSEVRLDGASGVDLARQIAEHGGWRPRVALMSAYPRPRVGVEDFFVAKPIAFDRLLTLLEGVDHEPGW